MWWPCVTGRRSSLRSLRGIRTPNRKSNLKWRREEGRVRAHPCIVRRPCGKLPPWFPTTTVPASGARKKSYLSAVRNPDICRRCSFSPHSCFLALLFLCTVGAMESKLTPLKQAAGGENVRILDLLTLQQQATPKKKLLKSE